MKRQLITAACLLAALVLAAGCSGDGASDGDVTYYQHIKPIVEKHCLGCHSAGGIGPFKLDSFASVRGYSVQAAAAMQSRVMPPWMPDPSCRKFEHERLMSDDEIATFKRWTDGGTIEGDESKAQTYQASAAPFEPTTWVKTATYTPPITSGDDYRCFILDLDFAKTTYMKASQVVPGSGLVHHVLVYALESSQVAAIEKADADEPGPGYTCFGGPLPRATQGGGLSNFAQGGATSLLPTQLGGWVPGMSPQVLSEDLGVRILAGSKIVMQIHYSALGGDPSPDQTELQLVLTDVAPAKLRVTRPVAIADIPIPAGNGEVVHSKEFTNYRSGDITIRSVMGHMHLLGSKFSVQKVAANGSSAPDECMLDIPKWDFNWQQTYVTPAAQAIVVAPGEKIRLTCTYDNSAANQPIVNGTRADPRQVKWGEGTLDEMCLLYIDTVEPFTPAPDPTAATCASARSCVDACKASPSLDCLLSCEAASDSCHICTLTQLSKCSGLIGCAAKLVGASKCLTSCGTQAVMLGGSLGRCLATECKTDYDALLACTDPKLAAGQCATQLASCGVTF